MTDYSAEIAALRAAIASGVTRVSYGDKSVEYDDLQGLKQRLQFLEALQAPRAKPMAGFASFGRGDR